MIHYWWSIPATCLMYGLYGWLTKQNNTYATTMWFWLLTLCGAIPLWSFISRTSKNLLMDGFIYDLCMLSAYVGMLILLGEAKAFSLVQWSGLILCFTGILLMKIGG